MTSARRNRDRPIVLLLGFILLWLAHQVVPAAAQPLQGGVQRSAPGPAAETFSGSGSSSPDLHKYLSPDGRFIDRCRMWRDMPDADTVQYGQPDHFAPGQPLGNTNSYNGWPAPYVRCAADPCSPTGGAMCWRNPGASRTPPPMRQQILDMLYRQHCQVYESGEYVCPDPRQTMAMGLPRPPATPGLLPGQPPASETRFRHCYIIATGTSCTSNAQPRPQPIPAETAAPCRQEPSQEQKFVLRKTGIEALDTMAAAGMQADQMINAFGGTIAAAAAQLLDPAKFVHQQIDNTAALLDLLVNKDGQSQAKISQASAALLEQAKRNPAAVIGSTAAQMVLGRAIGAGTGAACTAAVKATAATTNRLRGALQTVQVLKAIGRDQPKAPMGAGICSEVNPAEFENGCFPRSVALDQRLETPFPWKLEHFSATPGLDDPSSLTYITRVLKAQYGDRSFRTLDAARNLAQSQGSLIPMRFEEVQQNMAAAGNGARGLLFTLPHGAPIGHVVNVGFANGAVQIFDAEAKAGRIATMLERLSLTGDRNITQVWLFRTAGPDMVR